MIVSLRDAFPPGQAKAGGPRTAPTRHSRLPSTPLRPTDSWVWSASLGGHRNPPARSTCTKSMASVASCHPAFVSAYQIFTPCFKSPQITTLLFAFRMCFQASVNCTICHNLVESIVDPAQKQVYVCSNLGLDFIVDSVLNIWDRMVIDAFPINTQSPAVSICGACAMD